MEPWEFMHFTGKHYTFPVVPTQHCLGKWKKLDKKDAKLLKLKIREILFNDPRITKAGHYSVQESGGIYTLKSFDPNGNLNWQYQFALAEQQVIPLVD
jgi:hypothetical protein